MGKYEQRFQDSGQRQGHSAKGKKNLAQQSPARNPSTSNSPPRRGSHGNGLPEKELSGLRITSGTSYDPRLLLRSSSSLSKLRITFGTSYGPRLLLRPNSSPVPIRNALGKALGEGQGTLTHRQSHPIKPFLTKETSKQSGPCSINSVGSRLFRP